MEWYHTSSHLSFNWRQSRRSHVTYSTSCQILRAILHRNSATTNDCHERQNCFPLCFVHQGQVIVKIKRTKITICLHDVWMSHNVWLCIRPPNIRQHLMFHICCKTVQYSNIFVFRISLNIYIRYSFWDLKYLVAKFQNPSL